MATQGMVSIVVSNQVSVKVVAGSDGQNASLLAAEITRNHVTSPKEILALAKEVGFGNPYTLVVQTDLLPILRTPF